MRFALKIKLIFCFLLFNFSAFAEPLVLENKKIGVIDKQNIYYKDFKDPKIQELLEQIYLLLQRKFEQKALEQNFNQKDFEIAPITEKEILDFFQKQQFQASFEELKPQIQQYLQQQAKQKKKSVAIKKLYQNQKITFFLDAPEKVLVRVPIETAYIRGAKKAKVMLLEFSDYQCPFCKQNQPVINNLLKTYAKKVAFGYRHFPLSFHQEADEAALAVECAREQGQFEAYHELLFANTIQWSFKQLKSYAQLINIKDQKKFDNCLDTRKYDKLLEKDQLVALASGVQSTPTYIVGRILKNNILEGELIVGALPEEQISQIIQKYL